MQPRVRRGRVCGIPAVTQLLRKRLAVLHTGIEAQHLHQIDNRDLPVELLRIVRGQSVEDRFDVHRRLLHRPGPPIAERSAVPDDLAERPNPQSGRAGVSTRPGRCDLKIAFLMVSKRLISGSFEVAAGRPPNEPS